MVVIAGDTNVIILCLAFMARIFWDIHMRCGNKNRTMLSSINKITSALGKELCEALLGFYVYTGYSTVNALSRRGKLQGFKLMCQNKDFQNSVTELGTHLSLSLEVFTTMEEFRCNLYANQFPICEVNKLCYQLWHVKKRAVESSQLLQYEDSETTLHEDQLSNCCMEMKCHLKARCTFPWKPWIDISRR